MPFKQNQTNFLIRFLALFIISFSFTVSYGQNGVAINTTGASANGSAILDLSNSVNKGFLLPQVSSTGLVTTPATGLIVYQTGGTVGVYCNIGTPAIPNWVQLGSASGNGNYIINSTSLQSPGDFNIAGSGAISGTFTSSGGAINLNVGSANNTNIGGSGNSVISIGGTGNSVTNITSGNGVSGAININAGNNSPTNINTSSSGNVTIGGSLGNLLIPKFSTIGSVLYSSTAGGQIAAIAGSSGQVLTSNGAGLAPSWLTPTTGTITGNGAATQVAFWSGPTALSGDANLWWDNPNNRLGIGTSSPASTLTVAGDLTSSGGAINLNMNSGANATNINTGTSTGTVVIGGGGTGQTITVGGGANNQTINLGSTITAGTSTINLGTNADGVTTTILSGAGGVNINNAIALNRPTYINTGSSTGAVTIGSSAAQTINLGALTTGVITLGSTFTGTTNINSASSGYPTSAININYNNSKPININTGTNNTGNVTIGGTNTTTNQTITVGGSGLQTINVGASVGSGSVVTLGNAGGDGNNTTTNIRSGTGGVNINTTPAIKDVTIGNTSGNIILPKFTTNGTTFYTTGGTGTVTGLAPGSNGQVLTLNAGLTPTWATPTTGTISTFSSGNLPPLFTTSVSNANSTPALSFTLSSANAYTVFGNHTNAAGTPTFGKVDIANEVIGILPIANGGTNIGTIGAAGSIIYSNGTQHASTTVGSAGQVLISNGALAPTWAAAATGTVTSVGLALPNIFSVSGSPVTTSGVLSGTFVNQNANTVFAGPINGAAAAPTFRALVSADLPSGNGNYIQNQIVATQTADFKISGTGTLNALVSNASITNTGTLSSTAGVINLNSTGSSNFATNINTGTSTGTVTVGGSGTQTINIGTNLSNNSNVSLGTLSGSDNSTTTNISSGSGGIIIKSGTGGVNINVGNVQPVTIGGAGAQTISIGTALNGAGSVTIGNTSISDVVSTTILSGTGGVNINKTGTGPVTIGNTTGNLILPKFSTAGSILYSSTGGGIIAGTTAGISGQVLTSTGGGTPVWTTSTTGTVTSVGLSLPGIFTVSGSPVTTSGTLTGTLTTQNANLILAGPSSGAAAVPTFRTLLAADIPSGSGNYIQNQSASSQTANYWIGGPASIGTANVATQQLTVATSASPNIALVGSNTALASTDVGDGVDGFTAQSKGQGIYGLNTNSNGTAIIGAGNNVAGAGFYLPTGSGGAFTGSATGLYATYTSSGSPTQAIYTEDNVGNIVRVNYWSGTTQYKIFGAGTVSTVAENIDNNSKIVLHAPEAPEILFEDYGQGNLINGKAHITIDPIFSKNVTVNDKHPLRVFIQLEGDCNGVYVANKSKTGFDVIELKTGNSNVSFQWHIVCNRANETLANGKISHNEDMRFEAAPNETQNLNSGSQNRMQKVKKN